MITAVPGRWRLLTSALVAWGTTSASVHLQAGGVLMLASGLTVLVAIAFAYWVGFPNRHILLQMCALSSAALIVLGAIVLGETAERSNPVINEALREHTQVTAEVSIESYPRAASSNNEMFWVRAHTSRGGRETPLLLFFNGSVPEAWPIGEQLLITGRAEAAPIYSRHAYLISVAEWNRINHTTPGSVILPGLSQHAAELGQGIERLAQGIPGAELVPGFAVGAINTVPEQLQNQLKKVSLTHLTAVSGANCALVTGAVLGLLKWLMLPRKVRIVVAFAALVGFAIIVGPDASLQRATVMGTVVLLSQFTGQANSAYPALGAAILALLSSDPWLSNDIGFALSVCATLGILIAGKGVTQWLNTVFLLPKWVSSALALTLTAQLACAPILLCLQPNLSIAGLIANVFVAQVALAITALGLAATILLPFHEGVALSAVLLASIPARWVNATAQLFGYVPIPDIHWPQGILGSVLFLVSAVAIIFGVALRVGLVSLLGKHRAASREPWDQRAPLPLAVRNAAAVCFTIAICLIVLVVFVLPKLQSFATPKNWGVIACDVGQGDAILIRNPKQPDSTVLVDTGNHPEKLQRCLNTFNVSKLKLLILSHDDSDHVGALPEVLPIVENVLIAPPTTKHIREGRALTKQLERANVPYQIGEAGNMISLGSDFSFEVLGPEVGAMPNKANSASLVISVHLGKERILLLGDTGEKEQLTLLANYPNLRANIIKVAHHGSRDQHRFLMNNLGADWALVSVGKGNSYGHPARQTIEDHEAAGVRVLRTDIEGTIALCVELYDISDIPNSLGSHWAWRAWVSGEGTPFE